MEISARNTALPAFHLIIVAGGSGLRAGGGLPKQYRRLGSNSVLAISVQKFTSSFQIKSLNVVIAPEHEAFYAAAFGGSDIPPPVFGGHDRAASVMNGLLAIVDPVDDDLVLVHDAARPFVSPDDIAALLSAMGDAATLASPVNDTLLRNDGTYVERGGLWAVQTPQAFRYGLLRQAHAARALDIPATDDTMLVAALGAIVKIVPGSRTNFKITTTDDWDMAQSIYARPVPRTGLGFDVHAFDPGLAGPVRLCGVDVPHDRALLGHSDADVGLHAITDALLGAIAAGDIGHHFPPSDPQWKNADSTAFLAHAMWLVAAAGGLVSNIDVTLICEAPKVGPYRAAMQARIAEVCGLSPAQIGVKATTTEELGFTGRREGIAAQAVATVMMSR